jgi:multidrug resistance efflux pump
LGALPGTSIQKGQVLAVIESADLADAQSSYRRVSAEISQAQAAIKISESGIRASETRLQIAERTLIRQRQLASSGAFSSPALESAKSKVSLAESVLKSARVELNRLGSLVKKLELGVASGVVAQRELDDAKAQQTSAMATLADAEKQAELERQGLTREESIAQRGLRNAKEIEAAQAEVDLAKATLSSSRNQLLQSKADLSRVQSGVRVALDQIQLLGGTPGSGNRISVISPISCEVEKRHVSVGQTVALGQELYELLNADVVWVLSDVYEKDIPKVQIGQTVRVVADALPNRFYEGEVAFIHNEVDEKTRTTKVRAVVSNPGEKLKQNMFVRVALGVSKASQTLVPTSAIQKSSGLDVVFVEEVVGTYRRSIVQVQGTLGNMTIVKGVDAGKKVATDGSYQLLALGDGK